MEEKIPYLTPVSKSLSYISYIAIITVFILSMPYIGLQYIQTSSLSSSPLSSPSIIIPIVLPISFSWVHVLQLS
jgi:hypothetical protein